MKDTDPVVLATIKNASFKQDGEILELSFGNKWTADKMQEKRYQSPVIAVLNKIFWGEWKLKISHKPQNNTHFDDVL